MYIFNVRKKVLGVINSFEVAWQAVPGPVIFCNLLSVGQNHLWHCNLLILPPLGGIGMNLHFTAQQTTQPMQIHLKHAIESLLILPLYCV